MFICTSDEIEKARQFFDQKHFLQVGYLTVKNRHHARDLIPQRVLDDIAAGFSQQFRLNVYCISHNNQTRIILFVDVSQPFTAIEGILYDGLHPGQREVGIVDHLTEGDGLADLARPVVSAFSSNPMYHYNDYYEGLIRDLGEIIYEGAVPNLLVRNDALIPTKNFKRQNPKLTFVKPLFNEEPAEYFIVTKERSNHLFDPDNLIHGGTQLYIGPVPTYMFDFIIQSKIEGPQFYLTEMFYKAYFNGVVHFDLVIQEARKQKTPKNKSRYTIAQTLMCDNEYMIPDFNGELRFFIDNMLIIKNHFPPRVLSVTQFKKENTVELVIDTTEYKIDTEKKRVEFDKKIKSILSAFIERVDEKESQRVLTLGFDGSKS